MSRNSLGAATLLLGLAAFPAFAQTVPGFLPSPDHARTLEQNQRAYVVPLPSAPQAAAAQEKPVAISVPPVTGRRVILADKAR